MAATPSPRAACRSCGSTPHDGARFCDACGSQLSAATDAAEYKQVTVLFADVVRSMNIAATVDLERLREIMTELVERSAAEARRYGGTVEFTGDGVMALFGAPLALEDHAFRGCLAALAIQEEVSRLAAEVHRRDGVTLRLRVGLNSGRVIAGEVRPGSLGHAMTGEAIGFAQRMESAAPPGGVLLSESAARLVEHLVTLAEPEWVHVKGVKEPVRARRLTAIGVRTGSVTRAEANLVGRQWEMAILDAIVDRTVRGRGGVVNVVGPAGIGKSRVARETMALASGRGVEVVWAFCESHTREVPFHVVTQLLRAACGIEDLDGQAARDVAHRQVPDAEPRDLALFDDLLGIADPEVPLPQVDPEQRRRRLTALVNSASLARAEPALFIIEDAHWMDTASESLLADLLAVIPQTRLMVLITSRPEYTGALMQVPGSQTIALAPLNDSDCLTLVCELLGPDPSVGELAVLITDRAAGNAFFAEEMVRELVQRGSLTGRLGGYVCRDDVAELSVPATVQAAIAARIDRLSVAAKRTLQAASVIGARFGADLLAALAVEPEVDELLAVDLINQVRFVDSAEFCFHHPLIRTVAYKSQLKTDRARWHRRLAAAIQERSPDSTDENAALIASHLQAAGDTRSAYDWHMRAATWAAVRDIDSARLSWERARQIADAVPSEDTDRLSMRIAPRTMLYVTDGLGSAVEQDGKRFAELRKMCSAAGDKVSLAIAMSGRIVELLYSGHSREGARMASEQLTVLESIGDPTATMGLAFVAFCSWLDAGAFADIEKLAQTVIELAAGDPVKGAMYGFGSPLAAALAFHGTARWWLGRPGWRSDFDDALAIAERNTPDTLAAISAWTYGTAIQYGVLPVDDSTLRTLEDVVQMSAGGNSVSASLAVYTLGVALLARESGPDRQRGVQTMERAREMFLHERGTFLLPVTDVFTAREKARCGDIDAAIPVMRQAVQELHAAERLGYGIWATAVFAETLLERGNDTDVDEAAAAIDWLASASHGECPAALEVILLRLRALLARARGDEQTYRDLAAGYRAMAKSLGFEGHLALAETM